MLHRDKSLPLPDASITATAITPQRPVGDADGVVVVSRATPQNGRESKGRREDCTSDEGVDMYTSGNGLLRKNKRRIVQGIEEIGEYYIPIRIFFSTKLNNGDFQVFSFHSKPFKSEFDAYQFHVSFICLRTITASKQINTKTKV